MQVAILGEEHKGTGDQMIEEEVKGDPRLIYDVDEIRYAAQLE